ncbi:MAG: phosphorylase [Gemmatimonas sp. SG8_17]|nr:MAG: phosphorylase [Gemmatimonas sp. SG8_17]
MSFESGTLWQSVRERSEQAIRSGALVNIATRIELVEQAGVRFLVRVLESIDRKLVAGLMQEETGVNPFLPYDEDVFVATISDSHVCLLNKFNVVEHHVLLVTRVFEDQDTLLTQRDFAAMWICLREFDGLAFYNAGTLAGASQPHKHLQQVPVPFGPGPERVPIEPLIARAQFTGRWGTVPEFPFVHILTRISELARLTALEAGRATQSIYTEMLEATGVTGPYNLLATKDWMFLVPRSKEACDHISVNALGFAGSLLVHNEDELQRVSRGGPLAILEQVGVSRSGTQS